MEMYGITRCPHFTIIRVSVAHNIDRFTTAMDVITHHDSWPQAQYVGPPFLPCGMPGFSRQFFHTRFRGFEGLVCLRKQGIVTVFFLGNVHDRGK